MSDLLPSVDDPHVRAVGGDHDEVLRGLDLQRAPGDMHAVLLERNDAFTITTAGV